VDDLTPDQVKTLLRVNARNLAQKLKRGESLSASELKFLRSVQAGHDAAEASGGGGVRYAENQTQLAELLGVSRKTVQRHIRSKKAPKPLPNGTHDVVAWRSYMGRRTGEEDGEGLDTTELRAKNLLLQNERLELGLAIQRREYVPVAEVEKWGADLGGDIRTVVSQLHLSAPSLAGLSVPEIEERLKDQEVEILRQLSRLNDRLSDCRVINTALTE